MSADIRVARTPQAFFVKLHGRCTMQQSPGFHEFAARALKDGDQTLFADVAECQYLDSTFLGSLLDLHRKFGHAESPRFRLIAPADARKRLFEPTHLHKVFRFADAYPQAVAGWIELKCDQSLSKEEMARHVLDCHRRLAEEAGPGRQAFSAIADQLERELAGKPAGKQS